jgi:hypothetical protein
MFANQYILITQHQIVSNISLTVTLDMIIFHSFPGNNIFLAMKAFLNNFLPVRSPHHHSSLVQCKYFPFPKK